MKKLITLLLAVALTLTLVASASAATIGVSIRKYDDTFLTEMRNHMADKAEELGIEIDPTDSNADQTTQNNNIDLYLTKGYEALAVNMQERSAADVVIQKCQADDVPVVFFNTEPFAEALSTYDKAYYVGAKAEESGTMQGVAMAEYWDSHPEADKNGDGKIQYVMLMGEAGHQDAELRTEYSIKYLTDNGYEVECLGQDNADWDRVKGQDKMATFLAAAASNNQEIEAVFANNDDMALGAIEALKAQGYFGEGGKYVPVFGVDATAVGKDALREGTMLATSLNDAKNQAYATIELAALLANGETPTADNFSYEITDGQYVWIPYVSVTAENVDEFE